MADAGNQIYSCISFKRGSSNYSGYRWNRFRKICKNIAYYIKNKDTGFGTSTVIGKVSGYGVGVY